MSFNPYAEYNRLNKNKYRLSELNERMKKTERAKKNAVRDIRALVPGRGQRGLINLLHLYEEKIREEMEISSEMKMIGEENERIREGINEQ